MLTKKFIIFSLSSIILPISIAHSENKRELVGEWRLWGSQAALELRADGTGRGHAPSCSGDVKWSSNDKQLKIAYVGKLDCSIYDYQLGRKSKTMDAPEPDIINYKLRKVTDSTYGGMPVMELKGYNKTTKKDVTMVRPLVASERPKSNIGKDSCRDKIAEATRRCDNAGGTPAEIQMCKGKAMIENVGCL